MNGEYKPDSNESNLINNEGENTPTSETDKDKSEKENEKEEKKFNIDIDIVAEELHTELETYLTDHAESIPDNGIMNKFTEKLALKLGISSSELEETMLQYVEDEYNLDSECSIQLCEELIISYEIDDKGSLMSGYEIHEDRMKDGLTKLLQHLEE